MAAAILTTIFDHSMSARYRVRDSEAHKDESKYVEIEVCRKRGVTSYIESSVSSLQSVPQPCDCKQVVTYHQS